MKSSQGAVKKQNPKGSTSFINNMTIKSKLIGGFSIILVLMMVSTMLSFLSLNNVFSQIERYQKDALPNTVRIWTARRYNVSLQRYSSLLFNTVDGEQREAYMEKIASEQTNQDAVVEEIKKYSGLDSKILDDWDSILSANNEYQKQILDLAKQNKTDSDKKAKDILVKEYIPNAVKVGDVVNRAADSIEKRMEALNQQANQTKTVSTILLFSSLGLSLLFVIIIVRLITRSISNPVQEIEEVFAEMSKGNLNKSLTYESRDELGSMADKIRTTNKMLASYIGDISEKLTLISNGDMRFSVDLDYVGDFYAIKQALVNTTNSLNRTMTTIRVSAEQVNAGAGQVSSGSQALASGATEQAATVEELTASISTVAQQAEQNVKNVQEATRYVTETSGDVKEGNQHMEKLTNSMAEISTANEKISDITKVIEDIAFQTNILALNAAIEAARAGSAGKGFAVVADEVRNLAGKSAEAAQQTANLITHATQTVAEGDKIAKRTAEVLHQVSDKATLVNEAIHNIDVASSEQANAIEQIQQGISQVSAVIQENAATAEESSASSEELSAQAHTLRAEIAKFKLENSSEAVSVSREVPEFEMQESSEEEYLPYDEEASKY